MSERDDFEAWYVSEMAKHTKAASVEEIKAMRDGDSYGNRGYLNGCWDGWQAKDARQAEVAPYVVGNSYQMQNGEWVRFVKVHKEGTSYETMEDEAGVNRYTNRPGDYGRVTGSPHDYSDPRNTPPLYKQPPARVPENEIKSLLSGLRTMNRSEAHNVQSFVGDDEPCYYQRKEWVDWIMELCDEAEAALITHLPSTQTEHAASEIDPFWICDICKKRERLDNEDWCGVCKDEFYDSELHDAESSSIPDKPSEEPVLHLISELLDRIDNYCESKRRVAKNVALPWIMAQTEAIRVLLKQEPNSEHSQPPIKTCTYPDCNCPFDMGPDHQCLRGYPMPEKRGNRP